MLTIHDDLIVCHDCACLLANGENGEPSFVIEAFAEGMQAWAGYDLVLACTGEDNGECESRSWYRCAVCKVRTFGWGHDAVTFARTPITADVCAWCSLPGHESSDFSACPWTGDDNR